MQDRIDWSSIENFVNSQQADQITYAELLSDELPDQDPTTLKSFNRLFCMSLLALPCFSDCHSIDILNTLALPTSLKKLKLRFRCSIGTEIDDHPEVDPASANLPNFIESIRALKLLDSFKLTFDCPTQSPILVQHFLLIF